MATESPLIHDGGQVTASTNLQGAQFFAVALSSAGADRLVSLATVTTASIYGVLQNTPSSGQAADVGIFGLTKGAVGVGGWTPNMSLMVSTAGDFIAWTSGPKVGKSLVTASSGALGTMFVVAALSSF
jgi:hypothetical protein